MINVDERVWAIKVTGMEINFKNVVSLAITLDGSETINYDSDKDIVKVVPASELERVKGLLEECKRQIVYMAAYPIDQKQVRRWWVDNNLGPDLKD